jgi:hypothetical protein
MGFHVLLAMSVPCFLMLAYMAAVVLGLDPLWDAQYTVPMLGMLLVRPCCLQASTHNLQHRESYLVCIISGCWDFREE